MQAVKHPSIGDQPSTCLLQHRIKLVMQTLRIEIMSLSYHPLRLADVSVYAIAVYRLLAHLILPVPL
jgi:hypothetical protein